MKFSFAVDSWYYLLAIGLPAIVIILTARPAGFPAGHRPSRKRVIHSVQW